MSSPNNIPQGLRSSTWSQIIFIKATAGTDKNNPDKPVNAPPITTPKIEIRAFIHTLEPTIFGIRIFTSII